MCASLAVVCCCVCVVVCVRVCVWCYVCVMLCVCSCVVVCDHDNAGVCFRDFARCWLCGTRCCSCCCACVCVVACVAWCVCVCRVVLFVCVSCCVCLLVLLCAIIIHDKRVLHVCFRDFARCWLCGTAPVPARIGIITVQVKASANPAMRGVVPAAGMLPSEARYARAQARARAAQRARRVR